jgi:Uma2 family endonuclease
MKVIVNQEPETAAINFSKTPTERSTEIIWHLSVEKYHEAIAKGILNDETQLELLGGLLIAKMPKNPPHRISTKLLRAALENIIPMGWYVDSQEPITLTDSEPEPDVIVVVGQTTDYRDRHPYATDLDIVIEVSDSTLERDRTLKQRIYAKSMIPTYWILNLIERQLEVYTQPDPIGEKFSQCKILKEKETVKVTLKGVEIGSIFVGDLF